MKKDQQNIKHLLGKEISPGDINLKTNGKLKNEL
jgi:hypothetical protein